MIAIPFSLAHLLFFDTAAHDWGRVGLSFILGRGRAYGIGFCFGIVVGLCARNVLSLVLCYALVLIVVIIVSSTRHSENRGRGDEKSEECLLEEHGV